MSASSSNRYEKYWGSTMGNIKNLSASTKFKNTPIGEIPVDWGAVKLGEVAEIGAGDSAPQDAKYFENGTHLFIRTSDVGKTGKSHRFGVSEDRLNDLAVQELRLKQWPKGTILFPKSGASTFLNHRVLLSERAYVSSHLAAIVANNNSVPEFLYYYLSTIDAKSLVSDTNYPSLRLGDLAAIHVPLPPLPEQEKIAEVLTSVDDTIEKTQQLIDQTKILQNSVMHELLIHGISGLHKKFKKTILGEIPAEWNITRLGDVVEIGSGDSAPQDARYFENGTHLFIRTSDVGKVGRSHRFGFSEDKINEVAINELGLRQWPKGTILFPKSGASTFLNYRVLLSEPAYVSSHLATIVANTHSMAEFLYYYLLTIDAKSLVPDTNYPSLRLGDLEAIRIPLPPYQEQKRIAELLYTYDDNLFHLTSFNSQLEVLKEGLMQNLLSGRIRIIRRE